MGHSRDRHSSGHQEDDSLSPVLPAADLSLNASDLHALHGLHAPHNGSAPTAMVQYVVDFSRFGEHLIQVDMQFTATANQQVWLPTWIPGSYMIRDFSRHLDRIQAFERRADGCSLSPIVIQKISKNRWQLQSHQGQSITLRYLVYSYDLSVRGAYLDHTRAYANPACVCLAVAGQELRPISLTLISGPAFRQAAIATALRMHSPKSPASVKAIGSTNDNDTIWHLSASHYEELIDNPFEIAQLTEGQFDAGGKTHRISISGRHETDMVRLSRDLKAICNTVTELFGDAPFDDYLFLVIATGSLYGGLEHQRCTSLITPRDDLPIVGEKAIPSTAYRRFLGLCCHEYFHSWMVKTIRPVELIQASLDQEAYTDLLWVFEGFTSYYDDLLLYRSGVIDQPSYLELLAEQLSRYYQNPGRDVQSVSESSFDAWIKYYRPDENSGNAGTSYYNKGALVALTLDLLLRKRGSSLDALVQQLYVQAKQGQSVSRDTLPLLCAELTGDAMPDFFANYVYGLEPLPLIELLGEFGLLVKLDNRHWPFGMKVSDSAQGVQVIQVLRDSAAGKAGISANDVILAANGLKASMAQLQKLAERQPPTQVDASRTLSPLPPSQHSNPSQPGAVEVHLFRRDELYQFQLMPAVSTLHAARLTLACERDVHRWLGAPP